MVTAIKHTCMKCKLSRGANNNQLDQGTYIYIYISSRMCMNVYVQSIKVYTIARAMLIIIYYHNDNYI